MDSDSLVHEQLRDLEVVRTLRDWWGSNVVAADGRADRQAIARVVFSNDVELDRLQGLLYPRIEARRRELMQVWHDDPAVRAVVIDAPKLYEVGLDAECDAVIFVDAPVSFRLGRVKARHGWDAAELERREKLLIPLDTKRAKADYVVENHSSVGELRPKVERVFSSILAAFSSSP